MDAVVVEINDIAGNIMPIRKYDQNKYNRKFIEKNTEKIHTKHICEVCCGSYTYFNKSKHLKSKRHLDLLHKAPVPPPAL